MDPVTKPLIESFNVNQRFGGDITNVLRICSENTLSLYQISHWTIFPLGKRLLLIVYVCSFHRQWPILLDHIEQVKNILVQIDNRHEGYYGKK